MAENKDQEMAKSVVSIVCISYNHRPFVYRALESLRDQHHESVEVHIVDNASTDGTQEEISRFLADHPDLNWTCHFQQENIGNCRAFNQALRKVSGDYVMDLAADDWLYPEAVGMLAARLDSLPPEYGVVFGNIHLADAQGRILSSHYPVDEEGHAFVEVPQGELYSELVKRYFISPVGMMSRRTVMEHLGGYDERLAYEDFDFWVRSSRVFKYAYVDHIVAAKRRAPRSLSTRFYSSHHQEMFESTARVCEKIAWLNRSSEEQQALLQRIRYEYRQAIRFKAQKACEIYRRLQEELKEKKGVRTLYRWMEKGML